MKCTEQLSRDHQVILKALEILRATALGWRLNQAGAMEDCATLLGFLRTFADRCHHGKEEKALFPKLMQAGMAVEGGPLGVMFYEHDRGRELVRNMAQALDDGRGDEFELYATRYTQLLKDHIAKEDDVLFVKVEDILSAEDDQSILRQFDEIEHEMGEDTHERFHRMLPTLAARYPVVAAKEL
jgi:hemerythrin-like domain-containing protein